MNLKSKGIFITTSYLVLLFIISSCGTLTIEDTKVCAVAGVMSAGSDCVTANSKVKTRIDLDQTIDMLEGGALIIPVNDYVEMKKNIEQACVYLRCTKEVKKKLQTLLKNIEGLRDVNTNPESEFKNISRE